MIPAATVMLLYAVMVRQTPVEYRGPDAAEHFLRAIQEEERIIKDVLANPEVMRMTPEDILNHDAATACHIYVRSP